MSANSQDDAEIRCLFGVHVPEVACGLVVLQSVARERGRQFIVAVHSTDPSVCPVGSCVGPRGIRTKTIMRHLPGEKAHIVKWSASIQEFIKNSLAPVKVERIDFDIPGHTATISVTNPGSLAERVRLISRLVGWNLRVTGESDA